MLYTTSAPPGRDRGAMAFHAATGQTVLFSGDSGNAILGDTWVLQGETWTAVAGIAPPPRVSSAMAYDPIRGLIVLFGGSATGGSSAALQDTWEFDGTTWTQRFLPASPPARLDHSMTFDPSRGAVVLYGGHAWVSLGDMWEYDGTSWHLIAAANAPGPRAKASLCFDPTNEGLLLFGGHVDVPGSSWHLPNDTWSWNGNSWQQLQPATPPMMHSDGRGATDLGRARVIETSGINGGPFSWEWDGENWDVLLMASPGERRDPMVAYDSVSRRVVMFGGLWAGFPMADTWQYATPLPADVSAFGSGCAGSSGPPELRAAPYELPWVGDVMRNVVTSVPAGSIGALFVSNFAQLSPIDLSAVGMPGCELLLPLDIVEFSIASGGEAAWTTLIPNLPAVAGVPFYQQAFVEDGAANPLGFAASNGVVVTPGIR